MRTKKLPDAPQPLSDLCLVAKIKLSEIDYLIVGDGSGTTWEKGIGWASTVINCRTFQREPIYGYSNHGTNIVAEMKAYTEALEWLVSQKLPYREGGTRVMCLTDCEHIADSWTRQQITKKNRERWELLRSYQRRGLLIRIKWIPRAIWDLNAFADQLAGNCRIQGETLLEKTLKELGRASVYEINPSED